MQILHPFNDKTLDDFAQYRAQARSGQRNVQGTSDWTPKTIQRELFTTVLCLIELASWATRFDVYLRFSNAISLFRFDVSDSSIMVTEEDPQQPAYVYDNSDPMYDVFSRALSLQWIQGIQVTLPKLTRPIEIGSMTIGEAKEVICGLPVSLGIEIDVSDDDVENAFELYKTRENPYGF